MLPRQNRQRRGVKAWRAEGSFKARAVRADLAQQSRGDLGSRAGSEPKRNACFKIKEVTIVPDGEVAGSVSHKEPDFSAKCIPPKAEQFALQAG